MGLAGGGGVFVSYRREDSGDAAGRLADRRVDRFGEDRVFIDVEALEPGVDYVEAISGAVGACDVLLAVIGRGWLSAAGARGRRLDDPEDLVRVEVGTALARGARVIPVLVENADMPARGDLPDDLTALARLHALPVRRQSFRDDAARLVAAVERALGEAADGSVGSAWPAGDAHAGSAQKDPTARQREQVLAARLLDDAERAAAMLPTKTGRESDLSKVAQAAAATAGFYLASDP